jgi:hypothetical protein
MLKRDSFAAKECLDKRRRHYRWILYDGCSQFYQHFMSSFLRQYPYAKTVQTENVSTKKLFE